MRDGVALCCLDAERLRGRYLEDRHFHNGREVIKNAFHESCFYLKLLPVVLKIFDIPIAPGVVQWIVPDSGFQRSYVKFCSYQIRYIYCSI